MGKRKASKGGRRPRKLRRACPFILGEAAEAAAGRADDSDDESTEERGVEDSSRDEDDDESAAPGEAEQGGEVNEAEEERVEDSSQDDDDESAPGEDESAGLEDPSLHRRLDNERRRRSEFPSLEDDDDDENDDGDNDDDEVASYFPVALAVSPDRPLQFNFDMFLFDRMRLERGLFPEDEGGPVEFSSHEACREYTTRFVRVVLEGQASSGHQRAHTPSSSNSRHRLNKRVLFSESGSSLAESLRTGDETCDENLDRVRLDRYGNVMVWGAPAWSDLCPNYMHGFPRRLVATQQHGGFLPGNICVAARVSNVAMRSIAPGDVAAFCSKAAIQNLGLTTSELFLARRSALAYAGQARQPQRLVQTMLRFGVDFLTFAPLSRETLGKLQEAATVVERQHHMDFSPSSEDLASSQESASGLGEESILSDEAIDLDAAAVVSRLSDEQRAHVQTASYALDVVMWRHFVRPAAPQAATTPTTPDDPRTLGGDGRPPQRRAAADAAAQTSSAVLSGASSGRTRRRSRTTRAGGSTDAGGSHEVPVEEETLRARLARVPRVNVIHVPKSAALRPVRDFLQQHEPIAIQEIEERARTLPGSEWTGVASAIHRDRQMAETRSALQDVWSLAKRDCTCLAAGTLNGSDTDGTPSENCPFRTSDGSGQRIDPTSTACRATGCAVCDFFTKRYRAIVDLSASAGLDKASRFRALLAIASHLVPIVWSTSFASTDEQQRLKAILERVMSCRTDKLNSILAVGYLAHAVPRVAQVHLTSGGSHFWREMRKFGNALRHQPDRLTQIAVLQFLRVTCVPPGSKWAYFLTLEEEELGAASNPLLAVEPPSDEPENVVPPGGSSPHAEE